jgi:hypothetical protein
MLQNQQQQNSPQKRLVICLGLIGSIVVYIVLAYILSSSRAPSEGYKNLQTPLTVISVILFLLSAFWGLTKLNPLQTFKSFTTNMIAALAISEAITMLGLLLFFMGMPFGVFLPFAIATLVAQVFFVLPRVLTAR